jgi:arsenate reductase
MAEGWANHLKSHCIEAFSAGIVPARVSERAIKVMAEVGVDISNHTAKYIDDFVGLDFDYVVTVCDSAAEQCPVFPGKARMIHKGFEDPAQMIGTPQEIMDKFREVRDQIKAFVETMPEGLENAYG